MLRSRFIRLTFLALTAVTSALTAPVTKAQGYPLSQAESLDPVGNSSAAFADFIVKDIARYDKMVKATGAKPE